LETVTIHFRRRALTTFGTWAMRLSRRDNCGRPVMEIPMRMCATLSLVGFGVHVLNTDLFIGQRGAHVAHQPAPIEGLNFDIHRKFGAPVFPQVTARTRAGALMLSRARFCAGLAMNAHARPTVM